jgi:hypothetical protein
MSTIQSETTDYRAHSNQVQNQPSRGQNAAETHHNFALTTTNNNNGLLTRIIPDALATLFSRLTQQPFALLGGIINRLPSLKQFAWCLVQPVQASASRATLLSNLRASAAFERPSRLNQAAEHAHDLQNNAQTKEEFNTAFDWLSDKLLKAEKGDSIEILRKINAPMACENGQEDCARLLEAGVSFNTISTRYALTPPTLHPALKSLLTHDTLAALVAMTQISAQTGDHPEAAIVEVGRLLSALSDQLENSAKAEFRPPDASAPHSQLGQMIANCKHPSRTHTIERNQKHLQPLLTFKTRFANLLWSQHYQTNELGTQSRSTKNGTDSPKSVFFFPSETH